MGKWETCFWFSTVPPSRRRSCGNVGISLVLRDFQGVVGRGGILLLDFHAFHHSVISTALFFMLSRLVPAFVDSASAMGGWPAGVAASGAAVAVWPAAVPWPGAPGSPRESIVGPRTGFPACRLPIRIPPPGSGSVHIGFAALPGTVASHVAPPSRCRLCARSPAGRHRPTPSGSADGGDSPPGYAREALVVLG